MLDGLPRVVYTRLYFCYCLFAKHIEMIWQPVNLTEVCPAHTELTACTAFGYFYLNLLVQLFGGSADKRVQEYLREHKQYEDNDEIRFKGYRREEYDFIVVGAGASGAIVASRLSEIKDWKVLLLEAGPEQPDVTLVPGLSTALLGSNVDWNYMTLGNGKSCLAEPCVWPRGKMMGGSSSINSLAYIRGNRLDFDTWAAMGNDGWSYKDVLPFFIKSEDNLNIEALNRKYHGVKGPQYISRFPYIDDPSIMVTEAFNERGLPLTDFNGAQQLGTMQAQAISGYGQRVSSNNAFIQPIRYQRKNLVVRPDSEAVKILIDEHKRAYGVKYIRNGEIRTAFAKKEVIVSGGAINSPKLLMLSGVGPKEHLNELHIKVINDLPVGKNLHDHVTFNGVVVVLPNDTATTVSKDEVIKELFEYKSQDKHRGPLSGNGPVSSIAFIKTEPDLPAPDIQFQVDSVNWKEYVREPVAYDRLTIFPTAFYNGLIPRTMNLVPESRGVLLLNASDPYGPPILFPNYFGVEHDLIPILKGVRFLLSLEKTEAFKSRGAHFLRTPLPACKHYPWGTDSYYECLARSYTSTPYHPVGTCKMGPKSDSTAVVNPRLKVYGMTGLRVIDASIMPVVTRGNTNAPSLMIGEKGAELVKEDWLHSIKH